MFAAVAALTLEQALARAGMLRSGDQSLLAEPAELFKSLLQ
jgi:hypothetical protein